jgi:hypothetical protein
MKTAISIPDPVFDAAENLARRFGMSRSELYTRAVKAYLDAHNADDVTQRLNEIYSDEAAERLDPVISEIQARSIPREEW